MTKVHRFVYRKSQKGLRISPPSHVAIALGEVLQPPVLKYSRGSGSVRLSEEV
jgi:hypothetical protein